MLLIKNVTARGTGRGKMTGFINISEHTVYTKTIDHLKTLEVH